MRATEMHDLLADCHKAILKKGIWHKGLYKGLNDNVMFCDFCSYSQSHGHGERCVVLRLERAISVESEGKR